MNPSDFFQALYDECIALIGSSDTINASNIDGQDRDLLDTMIKYSSKKGATSVFITSLVYKHLNPAQDIRKHQDSMPGGYSGRTFDTKYTIPFLKSVQFSAAAESGWLSRSFETKDEYTLSYPAAISPKELKTAFLTLLDRVQNNKADAHNLLKYFFQGLILQRNKQKIDLAMPMGLTISKITDVLIKHFSYKYSSDGAARLPTLAIHAIYQCLVKEAKRFDNKILLELESHTAADRRSGTIGDVQVNDQDGEPFEAVEVKHGIKIGLQHIREAYIKFSKTRVKRYYILSTSNILEEEEDLIKQEIEKIKGVHGCQVIANGINKSLLYYIRLLEEPSEFIKNYVVLIENDGALKFEHKEVWNKIIVGMLDGK